MIATLKTIRDNRVINHRETVNPETWIVEKIDFMTNVYKFDDCKVTRENDVFTVRCHRNRKPRMKSMDVTFVLTVIG